MTRGRCGSLFLHRVTLSFTTPRRFNPAHGGTSDETPDVSPRGAGRPGSRSVLPVDRGYERPTSAPVLAGRQAGARAGAVDGAGEVGQARPRGPMGRPGEAGEARLHHTGAGR